MLRTNSPEFEISVEHIEGAVICFSRTRDLFLHPIKQKTLLWWRKQVGTSQRSHGKILQVYTKWKWRTSVIFIPTGEEIGKLFYEDKRDEAITRALESQGLSLRETQAL
jgi:hypothetical protein